MSPLCSHLSFIMIADTQTERLGIAGEAEDGRSLFAWSPTWREKGRGKLDHGRLIPSTCSNSRSPLPCLVRSVPS